MHPTLRLGAATSFLAAMLACGGDPPIESTIARFQARLSGTTVTSLTLSPSTIPGGSGGISTATVTLDAPAPAGGTLVTLASSNPGLAAGPLVVRVPEGSNSATFPVSTNAKFRRYSGLAFNVALSATAGGVTQSATLHVTAQPRPADIRNDSSQREGATCGGHFPASTGDHGVLYTCVAGINSGTVGHCTFKQECLLGCVTSPEDQFKRSDFCATSGSYPIAAIPAHIEGGNPATVQLILPVAAPSRTNARSASKSPYSTIFPTGFFTVPTGATTVDLTGSTSIVPTVQFAAMTVNFEIPEPSPSGGTFLRDRTGMIYLAIAPPENPPDTAQPVLAYLTVDQDPVTGGASSNATVWLSGLSSSGGPTISLASSDPAVVSLPASVTIPPGSNVVNVPLQTQPVSASTTVTLTATEGPRVVTETLTVVPNTCTPTTCAAQGKNCGTISDGCGGFLHCGSCTAPQTCGGGGIPNVCGGGNTSTAVLTVSATGRSGERVRSSPAGIDVAVGSTQSASFGVNTSITLSATNNRDVIWSGACSSGGAKTKSCTFTLSANASVTANVQ
jgi:hypothetical protein